MWPLDPEDLMTISAIQEQLICSARLTLLYATFWKVTIVELIGPLSTQLFR